MSLNYKLTSAGLVIASLATGMWRYCQMTSDGTNEASSAKTNGIYCLPVEGNPGVMKCSDGNDYKLSNESGRIVLTPTKNQVEITDTDKKELSDFIAQSDENITSEDRKNLADFLNNGK